MSRTLRIGSRGSKLALVQSEWVRDRLRELHPGLAVEIEVIHTKGDKILDAPLAKIGDKGLFTKELEAAILDRRVDIAVHSAKDMPTETPDGLAIVAFTAREDVRDVFVNGRALVRDRVLTTVDVEGVLQQAKALAKRINRFFIEREGSVLDKLVDIGGLEQGETFEVQVKGVLQDEAAFARGLADEQVHITQHTTRDQYDTYMMFGDPEQGRLRYREDHIIRRDGSVEPIYFLTLTGPVKEAEFENSVILSRSRFTAAATRSLRFYREYFQPAQEKEIVKHRERYHIRYKGVDFAVNLDRITQPAQDKLFVEIKSRTWSRQDAMRKAALIGELLAILGAQPEDVLKQEYVDLLG